MEKTAYILEVLICSGLFLGLYRWLLAGKVSFRICRAYIVTAMYAAVLIPAMDIPLYTSPQNCLGTESLITAAGNILRKGPDKDPDNVDYRASADVSGSGSAMLQNAQVPLPAGHGAEMPSLLLYAYALIAAGLLLFTAINTVRILAIRRKSRPVQLDKDCTLVQDSNIRTPFSFLGTVYIGTGLTMQERTMIIAHEASHVRHRHSYERILLTILRDLMWFNPFLWMAEKDLKAVQEWEADRDVLNEGTDLTVYRTAIFRQLFGCNPDISCGLNHSLTKKRFIMMTKTDPGRLACLRLAATVPLIAATILAFGSGSRNSGQPLKNPHQQGTGNDTVTTIRIIRNAESYTYTVNGSECNLEDIGKLCFNAAQQSGKHTVRIEIPDGIRVGTVTDVRNSLRSMNIRSMTYSGDSTGNTIRIEYRTESTGAHEILPPPPGSSKDTAVINITRENRNHFRPVALNARNQIMMDGYHIGIEDITAKAAGLIRQYGIIPDNKDGSSLGCIFSLQADRAADAEIYTAIKSNLRKAYGIVRDEYSMRTYGKPFNELTDKESDAVKKAIPVCLAEPDQIGYQKPPVQSDNLQ